MIINRDLKSIFPPNARYWEFDWFSRLDNKENELRHIFLVSILAVSIAASLAIFSAVLILRSTAKPVLIIYGIIHAGILVFALASKKVSLSERVYLGFLFLSFIANFFYPVFDLYFIVPFIVFPPAAYMFLGITSGSILNFLMLLCFNVFYFLSGVYGGAFGQKNPGIYLYILLSSAFCFEMSLLFLSEYIGHCQRVSLFTSRMYDETTSLPKRYIIDHTVGTSNYVYIAILSIRNLSHIGIIMGYDFLTKVTKQIANILKEHQREAGYSLFRLMKGEFGIVLEDGDYEKLAVRGGALVRDLSDNLKNIKITHGNLFIYIEMDIGYAIGKSDHISEILSKADQMKLDPKANGDEADRYVSESDIRNRYIEDQRKYDVLLANIANNTMELHFQPVVHLGTGELLFYESLLRLKEHDDSIVSVYEYLDISKKTGMYPNLTVFVLETVFARIRTVPDACFSVNLCLSDIENLRINEFLIQHGSFLAENNDRIIFEITESEISTMSSRMQNFLAFAKDLDIKIAIDDFGTGYSNFTRLSDFPPYICKIDGQLFKKAYADSVSSQVLEGIVTLCRNLNVLTVAEYIETEAHKTFAEKIQIDFGQGYFFSKPLPGLKT